MAINRRFASTGGGGEAFDPSGLEADIAALESDVNDEFVTVGNRLDSFDGISNVGSVGSTLTITPGLGNGGIKLITLTDDCTITFNSGLGDKLNSLELVLAQDATGGREVTWNETVKWPGGVEPTLSTAPNAVDRIIFTSYDGGSTWFGDLVGLGYA